ncbi:hypothetical protein L3X38_023539 [Prunus dulcis]|uniref:Uncharacterized protein n=1 Tax=Prunus dulcis TaxID=3755 RepID=A0AAD4VY71_PRUDU|nr:hypothetical protein L3X38_023539 [Prunus dulcis]
MQFWLVLAKERLVPCAVLARADEGAIGALCSLGSCRQRSILVPYAVLARAGEGAFDALCSFGSCRRRSNWCLVQFKLL